MLKFETQYQVDKDNKKIIVNRTFNASIELLWKAWTSSDMLDQWWAPKPWKTQTKKMNFVEGGSWLYCMIGPEGEKHWSGFDYLKIEKNQHFYAIDYFCDEQGIKSDLVSPMKWFNHFKKVEYGTAVEIEVVFEKLEDLEKLVAMGFMGGFSMGHSNLDDLLISLQKV